MMRMFCVGIAEMKRLTELLTIFATFLVIFAAGAYIKNNDFRSQAFERGYMVECIGKRGYYWECEK